MEQKNFKILNETGLHARPAALFVQLCNKFKSEVTVRKNQSAINAKSIIGILALGVAYGDEIQVEIEGPDAIDAMKAISEFLEVKIIEKK